MCCCQRWRIFCFHPRSRRNASPIDRSSTIRGEMGVAPNPHGNPTKTNDKFERRVFILHSNACVSAEQIRLLAGCRCRCTDALISMSDSMKLCSSDKNHTTNKLIPTTSSGGLCPKRPLHVSLTFTFSFGNLNRACPMIS